MMKKKILLLLFATFTITSLYACDICGCGVGNNYIGILPEFNSKIVGLRYRYNSLLTHVGVGGATTYLTTSETYQTTELWAGWNINRHFRVMASLPYGFNTRLNQGSKTSKNGIGDASANAYFQLINNRKTLSSNNLLVQSLWLGVGIKTPTGKYNPVDKEGINENANLFQLGTGSLDFMLSGMYDIRLQDVGVNVAASYKLNTANKYKYQYGNKASVTTQAYCKLRIRKQVTLSPNAGIQYERSQKDNDRNFSVDVSGGNLLLATTGAEVAYKKMAFGGNWQLPLFQHLGKGFVQANNRVMVHVAVIL